MSEHRLSGGERRRVPPKVSGLLVNLLERPQAAEPADEPSQPVNVAEDALFLSRLGRLRHRALHGQKFDILRRERQAEPPVLVPPIEPDVSVLVHADPGSLKGHPCANYHGSMPEVLP